MSCLRALLLLAAFGATAHAGTMTFATRTAFDLAAPDLPTEDFESALVLESIPGFVGFALLPAPIDETSHTDAFAPGDILPGITIDVTGDATPTAGTLPLVAVDPVLFPSLPGRYVGTNLAADGLDLLFGPGVHAIAFDFTVDSGVAGSGTSATISVFAAGGLLTSTTLGNPESFSAGGVPSGFFGVLTSERVTRITIQDPDGGFEFASDVTFGDPVPEPNSLLFAGIGALGLGFAAHRRRRGRVA